MSFEILKDVFDEHAADALSLCCSSSDTAGLIADLIGVFMLVKNNYGQIDRTPNPLFLENGFSGAPSIHVKKYFKRRKLKNIGGAALSFGGGLLSPLSLINLGSAGLNTMALTKTGAHLFRLEILANQIKGSRYLTGLCKTLINLKRAKLGSSAAHLAFNLVPDGGIISGAGNAAVSVGTHVYLHVQAHLIEKVAKELHWRAYQEQALTRNNGSGPAMRMVRELFAQAAVKTGDQDTLKADRYIKEASGYLVLIDKLTLL